ncbi:MAG: tRNA (adenosine(37)-N6)-threonylcarbamoyltransferase complex dimerization subunit type 1 TsaB [Candidatus Eisenbacteria bacterium]|uniref:tRNA (Adenosine(37)-N6)-threonylcarbamoyltransferase complex dimerization subunit type 1 TsaB n=1 Tax=Eiseniibacteriota bacterium TaxID=2212470 RepID=A0A948W5K4_UNCEI|nr:tRNA (adenosine(37)-N6)-threonylcarbamoyltransferase complex dimerization subunit type 1 TsaB [Candidatus Eisenbacteria bacterium]MBU1949275.1 tRNA (adenosine(37)-N6)-threonylcarbamoyltransferase complex dimerization subunit type 1 TsaB [Candidatus Eisenbacteria bacterium]MBU2689681.1 tRNA (adenosine(37)-N6)-threonylcarbamoyltransferase complex dimerization subunit type 1 TsaB [Candidatus Eisenbacteria bacterium]
MRILGIETSGPTAEVALMEDQEVVAAGSLRIRGRTGERLIDLIDSLFQWADWELGVLQRIAIDIGPGSFTGLRVGLALAKGLSLGTGIAVVPVSSLEALAAGIAGDQPVLATLPAPKGRVYAALLQRDTEGYHPLIAEACWEPSTLRAEIGHRLDPAADRGALAGPGIDRLDLSHQLWRGGWRLYPELHPSAVTVALCGSGTGRENLRGKELAALVPRYLKGADVRRPQYKTELPRRD